MKNKIFIMLIASVLYAGCCHDGHRCQNRHTCPPVAGTSLSDTVSYDTAISYVDHFSKKGELDRPLGVHLDKAFLMTFLADSNVTGINVYNGVKDGGELTFIVNQTTADSTIGQIYNTYPSCMMIVYPCRPRCGP